MKATARRTAPPKGSHRRPASFTGPGRVRVKSARSVAAPSAAPYHGRFHPLSAPGRYAHLTVSRKFSQATASATISATREVNASAIRRIHESGRGRLDLVGELLLVVRELAGDVGVRDAENLRRKDARIRRAGFP